MARTTSNLPEIRAIIAKLGETLAFDRPGSEGSVGTGALGAAVGAIAERCRAQEAPDGREWAKNKPWAQRNPQKRGKPVGVLTGEMLSAGQLAGEPTVSRDSATLTYGVTEEAKRKAEWFSEGNANQEARPFFDIGPAEEAAVDRYLDAEVDRYLGSL